MSREAILHQLREAVPLITPSMLKCDFGNLHREVELLETAGVRAFHLDVMDGHFVPNLTYGPVVIERLRELSSLPFDAHLMISEPARYLDDYLQAGCDCITFHVETAENPIELLARIRDRGAVAGVALNPGTPLDEVADAAGEADLVLVMSVEPGFGGQEFMPVALDRIKRLKEMVRPEALLSIDGGVGKSTIAACAEAGANVFVVGSAIFEVEDYGTAISELTALAQSHVAPTSLEN